MKKALLFVLALAAIPVGIDAQGSGLAVDDPEVLRYQIVCACGPEELDEYLVADLLNTKLRAGGITPERTRSRPFDFPVPLLLVTLQPVGGRGWAYNVQFLQEVSYQARGQTYRRTAATYNSSLYFPAVLPFFGEESVLNSLGFVFDKFIQDFRRGNGL